MDPVAGELERPVRRSGDAHDRPRISRGSARYGVGLLALIYLLGFLDRQILSILAEPIKRDLHLADWQIGAVTGLSFALLYTVLGVPIARIAETGDRRRIISVALFVWSVFTMLCAFATRFAHLAVARLGVGVGEAGCTPSAMSLISDYVPKERRSSATAIYLAGGPFGALLGMALGGVVADLWGWRAAFLFAGAPGVLVAVLAFLTLPEPRRSGGRISAPVAVEPRPPFPATLRRLRSRGSYVLIVCALTLTAAVQYSTHAFLGSFFFRNHAAELAATAKAVGLKPAGFLGISLGTILGLSGIVGATVGGYIADRFARRDVRRVMLFIGGATMCAAPLYWVALSAPSLLLALSLFAASSALMHIHFGPAYGMVQGVVSPVERATATAVLLFVVNLLGLGGGPLLVGLISDTIAEVGRMGDAEGVRWALYVVSVISVPAGLLFISARTHLARELES